MKTRLMVLAAALAGGVAGTPALADVKAGVEAWSRGDYPAAVAQWRAPAAAGDADAQFNLGQAYKLGRGVAADPAQAVDWFRKAAAQNHPQATDNYALALFQDGKKAEALPWLEKSVARDEKRTELVLGTMLFNGDGVPRDWTRAYALVTRSSQQGLPQGSQTLAQMDKYIPEAQRQQGVALARQIEARGRSAGAAPATAIASAEPGARPTPARVAPAPTRAGTSYAQPGRPERVPASEQPRRPDRAEPRPRPAPAERSTRATAAPTRAAAAKPAPERAAQPKASGGAYRIQLGAFANDGNARSLWSSVGARVGGTPSFARSGNITRLQVSGFASKAEAQRACTRAGSGCVVLPR
ncbi:SEL1-like repeat protein [Sphingomonas sp. HHU CXW]|uniref:SEL1-like repeat protein n=1 Tax=Sphingomonas hominis TaxID=2741495 RepID=A0ABX2JH66_9SPHN|nr:SPOR domain-containing protein [Sphingomonas hominis]NTS65678.1 SEL1-like repeat protein [Sphingomonas hominis]